MSSLNVYLILKKQKILNHLLDGLELNKLSQSFNILILPTQKERKRKSG